MISRKRGTLAAVALLALISAGCSNPTATTGAAGAAGRGTGSSATNLDQAVKFAQCMRANGVSDFPDPDSSGQLTIDGVVNGSSLNPNTPTFQQALNACKELEPPGFMGTTRTAQQQQAALRFAQCMRDNGVPDFPDPSPNGPLIDVNGAHSIPGFQAAQSKCGAMYAGQLGLRDQ
jgi:hypothetical protein